MSHRMMDVQDDLWTIFECGYCGVLFFFEEKIQNHIMLEHKDGGNLSNYLGMEFIRAIPQNKDGKLNPEWKPNKKPKGED